MLTFGMPALIEIDSLEETAKLADNLGLSFIELNMNLPKYQCEGLSDIDYLKEIMEKYSLYFTIHLNENLNPADFNSFVADAYCETVKRTIDVAQKINAPILNMHMNHGVHFTLPNRKVQLFQQYFDDYMSAMLKFRKISESEIGESNIKISIENTDGYRSYEKSAVESLLKSKVFSLTWDIGHSNSADNIDEPFIMQNENKLVHFHIHDSLGKKDHLTLGKGEVDLPQRLSIAERNHCRCVVETKTVSALKESFGWLKNNGYI